MMNKKVIIGSIVTIMLMTGCSKNTGYPDFLTEHEWEYKGEIMEFTEKGEFGCYISNGNPVGVYEFYDDYIYNYDTGIVTIMSDEDGYEDIPMEIVRHDKENMLVRHEDKVKEMHNWDYYIAYVPQQAEEYVEDFSTYSSIVEISGNEVKLTSSGYTEKKEEKNFEIYTDKLAKDIEFYNFFAKVYTTLDLIEDNVTIEYEKLTETEVKEKLEQGAARAFVWYNYDLEIEKIVFYEEHKWKGLEYSN